MAVPLRLKIAACDTVIEHSGKAVACHLHCTLSFQELPSVLAALRSHFSVLCAFEKSAPAIHSLMQCSSSGPNITKWRRVVFKNEK